MPLLLRSPFGILLPVQLVFRPAAELLIRKMNITLKAKSSRGTPHAITVSMGDTGLRMDCTCEAGQRQMLCKHRLAVASNDVSILFDTADEQNLVAVQEWLKDTDIPTIVVELRRLESELVAVQHKVSGLKQSLAKKMRGSK